MRPTCPAPRAPHARRCRGEQTVELDGITPLHDAAAAGKAQTAWVLLQAGADPSATEHGLHGRMPLHAAAKFGHAEVAQVLLSGGADCEAKARGVCARAWVPVFGALVFVAVCCRRAPR